MGCNEHKPKGELIRVVRSPEGEISLDFTGRKNGRGATRGKLRMKIMTDMTLLKAYNAFKASPMGKAYVKAAKGDEYIICEEYAAKVLAHQYGTEAEQKAIEKFVEDNAPDFPVAEYIRKVRTLDELYGAPKTVE